MDDRYFQVNIVSLKLLSCPLTVKVRFGASYGQKFTNLIKKSTSFQLSIANFKNEYSKDQSLQHFK